MDLGAFSISLAVKDLGASRSFYEKVGWDQSAQKLPKFTDVRELQRQLAAQGVQFQQRADESTKGPASFIAVDPDGNPLLVDQHV